MYAKYYYCFSNISIRIHSEWESEEAVDPFKDPCFICEYYGHGIRNCPNIKWEFRGGNYCLNCWEAGHLGGDCSGNLPLKYSNLRRLDFWKELYIDNDDVTNFEKDLKEITRNDARKAFLKYIRWSRNPGLVMWDDRWVDDDLEAKIQRLLSRKIN